MSELPKRIECFDISHFQGQDTVASQVVFEDGVPAKDNYRLYKIKTAAKSDDYAAMREVLSRRLEHTEYDDPQLIVVDGGKGQLKMAVEILSELDRSDIPVAGLAKARTLSEFEDKEIDSSQERFYLPGRVNPVTFHTNSEAYRILVSLRDEAHRFAITFHRKLRENSSLHSVLDDIKGLGETRKKKLLEKFENIEVLRRSTIDDIAEISGFNRELAASILDQLKNG
jgi:excinuclease ABC subunit C